ncbi:acyl-CoA N-acyltransferase [Rozella allomycis CSF55]|uniref:Acyl-CoA N-acyltransferase n=1 Tax=Rozella allomycis (strain CSF55) TaxID=988480 RepID=A0A4P9YEC0_ROZAC|nr:acyl-CoA N-acyltransferase [Rozella allomycis CSF55]
MTTLRLLKPIDLLKLQNINLDYLTENYTIGYYLNYLLRWPKYFIIAENIHKRPMGYKGLEKSWHGHVSALSVAFEYRRLGVASFLMTFLENVTDKMYVMLRNNQSAVDFYHKIGYTIYREVLNYYCDGENAYGILYVFAQIDMRKPMDRDIFKDSLRNSGAKVTVDELTFN